MLQEITAVTVPSDGSAAKSAMIATQELISGVEAPVTVVSLAFGSDLEGTEDRIRWYASLTGVAASEFVIKTGDDGAIAETLGVAASCGVEVDIERFLRWPYLVMELRSSSAAVPHGSDRSVNIVAGKI
jgi:hypothetical protein